MENKHANKSENPDELSNQSISTSEFLDFLKLTCRVHETIILKDENATALDYNALAKNELVNCLMKLKSGQSPKANGIDESCGSEKNGELKKKKIIAKSTK